MIIPSNQTLCHKGQEIKFHKVGLKTENQWMMWATKKLPNPLSAIKNLEGLPPDVAKEIAVMAYKDFKKGWSVDDPEIEHLKKTPEGVYHHIRVLIQLGNDWTEDKACETLDTLLDEVPLEKILETCAKCVGEIPSFLSQPQTENLPS